jgi:hypothetical protein
MILWPHPIFVWFGALPIPSHKLTLYVQEGLANGKTYLPQERKETHLPILERWVLRWSLRLPIAVYILPKKSHLRWGGTQPCWLRIAPQIKVCGASKIKLKKVNKKRTVIVRRVIIFLNISRHPLLICLQCCLHQYRTLKAEATATAAIVLLTPAKNLKKVFLGFLIVSPLFNHFLGYVKIYQRVIWQKKIDSKTFETLAVILAIYWIFEVKKIRPENIAIKGHKNCIFLEKCT